MPAGLGPRMHVRSTMRWRMTSSTLRPRHHPTEVRRRAAAAACAMAVRRRTPGRRRGRVRESCWRGATCAELEVAANRRRDAQRRARGRRAVRTARASGARGGRASRKGASDEICRTHDTLMQRSSPLIAAAMLGAGLCARASPRARCRRRASWASLRRRRSSPPALSRAVGARA